MHSRKDIEDSLYKKIQGTNTRIDPRMYKSVTKSNSTNYKRRYELRCYRISNKNISI